MNVKIKILLKIIKVNICMIGKRDVEFYWVCDISIKNLVLILYLVKGIFEIEEGWVIGMYSIGVLGLVFWFCCIGICFFFLV